MASDIDFEPYSLIDDDNGGKMKQPPKQAKDQDKKANGGAIKQDFKRVEPNLDVSKLDYSPDYTRVTNPQMHRVRRQLITKEFPKIKEYQKPYPMSAVYTVLIVVGQTLIAWLLKDQSYLVNFLFGYTVGAILCHSLWVLIHDYCHDAVFKDRTMNKLFLVIADLVHLWPGGISFARFHRQHHGYLNETYGDPDLPSPLEDKIFGHSSLGKATWLFFFPFIQSLRMERYGMAAFYDIWFFINIFACSLYTLIVFYLMPYTSLLYLFVSTLFSIGLHPLGARWVAEHYAIHPWQETYSYYGSANLVSFNIGYHNEHHDFPTVPWVHLPEVRRVAMPYYEALLSHSSYWVVLFNFIFNPRFTLRSRVVRSPADKSSSNTAPTYDKIE